MLKTKLIPLVILLLSTSCATNGHDNDDFCIVCAPIYFAKTDKVSGETARQVDAYNDYGQKRCGWKSL